MKAISLFSGIGGMDLAAEAVGIETILFVELDRFCQAILNKHWPKIPIIGDIHNVTRESIEKAITNTNINIIFGGDPCQPRSVAGKRRGREDPRDLWSEMFRVICEFKPTWIINENPTGRITMDFNEVLSNLESQGYETRSFVIPACAVSAPHRRDRLYIVGYSASYGCDNSRALVRSGHDTDIRLGENQENKQIRQRWEFEPCAASGIITYSPGRRFVKYQPFRQEERDFSKSCEQNITNANVKGLSPVCPKQTKRDETYTSWNQNWYEVATSLCRMDDGIPHRVARLKALGNAQVPQQVYPIFKAIVETDRILHNDTYTNYEAKL